MTEDPRIARYEQEYEGREHAWGQLEAILAVFGETTDGVDISAVAGYVQTQVAAIRAEQDKQENTNA